MSPAQKFNFFMPAWNAAVRSLGWHTRDHAAVVDDARLTTDEHLQVVDIAEKMARKECRRMTLRDLRHACTIVCLGKDKDTDRLNNDEQDYIVALFKLLANPMDLQARSNFEACKAGNNPGKKTRRQYFIKSRAPEAVLRHLTADLTSGQTKNFEGLDDKTEAELARLLAQRPVYGHSQKLEGRSQKAKPVSAAAPAARQQPKNYVIKPHLVYTKGPF